MRLRRLPMTLAHYAQRPVGELEYREHRDGRSLWFDKPTGFWVSPVGSDDWRSFASENGMFCLSFPYRVLLRREANLLVLQGARELHEFTGEYGIPMTLPGLSAHVGIDWKRLRLHWDGVIIAPYVWSLRMETAFEWYYGWDCASGCIWNHEAVAALQPMRRWARPQPKEETND